MSANAERLRIAIGVGEAIEEAARLLPEGWIVRIDVEKGAATVELAGPQGNGTIMVADSDNQLQAEILAAIANAQELAEQGREWRWVDEKGRAMTPWKAGPPPVITTATDSKGTMRIEQRHLSQEQAT